LPEPISGSGGSDKKVRERVLRRDQFRCVYCGIKFPPESLTVDHVQPRMRGGDHSEGNLVAACRPCNADKGSAPAWAYLAERPEQLKNFLEFARSIWPRHRRAVLEASGKKKGPPSSS
jgi:5-methylcytosine-specific restriction endonuclease McrA